MGFVLSVTKGRTIAHPIAPSYIQLTLCKRFF